ncbi:hypothetical protein K503DRAFT_107676 [Rhizopogon vinicolor AM-OR11-026]|uniref:ATP-dependent DNA helicase n=1 Tax=Rhizopogon vinicolor AM-OR11-026 TaxID=1314800 RepID=A0A1B7NFG4_9AGAM|nr:hypothetical protein K503DRAFT_107676 [Rhizopogon vinicolor AM-OR11-026]
MSEHCAGTRLVFRSHVVTSRQIDFLQAQAQRLSRSPFCKTSNSLRSAMPVRYYAVRIGREGPKIYSNYHDFQMAICGLSGSSGKGFDTYREAEAWLTGVPMPAASVTSVTSQTTSTCRFLVPGLHSNSITSCNEQRQWCGRPYPGPQPDRRWSEYESPLNTRHARPNGDRLTPPPPYIPLARYDVPREPEIPPPLLPPQPAVELSEEQKQVLRLVQNDKNIFFTGPAGTGKSVLLRAIIDVLRVKFGGAVAITAPTGIAGVNIGGSTIHSWAGIRLGKEGVEKLVNGLSRAAIRRWLSTCALVIEFQCWMGAYSTSLRR